MSVLALLLLGAAGGAWAFSRYGENLPGQTVDVATEATPEEPGEGDRSATATPEPTATAPPTEDPTTATPSATQEPPATPNTTPEATPTPRSTKEPTAAPNTTATPSTTATPNTTATPTPRATREPTPDTTATPNTTATPDSEASAERAASYEPGELAEPAAAALTQVAEHGYVAVTDLGECGRFMFQPSQIPNDATREVDETSGCPYVKSIHRGDGHTDIYVLDLYEGQRLHIGTAGLDDPAAKVTGPSGPVRLDRDSGNGELEVLIEAEDGAGPYRLLVEDRGAGGEYRISFQDVSHGLVTPVESVATDDDCAIVWLTPNAIPNDAEISIDEQTKCPHIAGVTRTRGDRDIYVLGLIENQAIAISTQGLNKSFVTITGPNGQVVVDQEYEPGNIDLVLDATDGNGGYVFMIEEEGNGDEYSISFVDVTDGATLGG